MYKVVTMLLKIKLLNENYIVIISFSFCSKCSYFNLLFYAKSSIITFLFFQYRLIYYVFSFIFTIINIIILDFITIKCGIIGF